jgi:hypothetical protein
VWSKDLNRRKNQDGDSRFEDMFRRLAWLSPEETTLGVKAMDCRPTALGLISTTPEESLVQRWLDLRASTGEELRGTIPDDAITVPEELHYPRYGQPVPEGCAFRSQCMEDKWDGFILDSRLYLRRSWSGHLVYKASISFGAEAVVSGIQAGRRACEGDPAMALRQVDYLVRSHLLELPVAHPIPVSVGDNPKDIALYSFSVYGRKGIFASFQDTTKARPWFFDDGAQDQHC